jgi:hypothetical protein
MNRPGPRFHSRSVGYFPLFCYEIGESVTPALKAGTP